MANSELQRVVTSPPLLTDLAIDQSAVPESFIGARIAPDYEVPSFRFSYPIYGKELILGTLDDAKSVKGEYKETEIEQDSDTSELMEHGLKAAISKRERLEAQKAESRDAIDPQFTLQVRTAAAIRAQVQRRREYLISLKFTSPAVYSAGHTDDTVAPMFDTADDILAAIDTLRQKVIDDSGFAPNFAIVGQYYRMALRRNASFRGLLPTTQVQAVTQDALAELLQVDTVEWGSPVIAANADAQPAPAYDDVLWLGYVNPATNSKQPTFARTFWMPYEDGRQAYSGTINILPEDTMWVWYAEMYETVVTGKDLGALLHGGRAADAAAAP